MIQRDVNVDVWETGEGLWLRADLPGVEEKDLEVTFHDGQLMVSGKRESEQRKEEDNYHLYERSFGSFSRSFVLPNTVNSDAADAALKDGVLTITLPKKGEAKPKKIPLKK